MPANRRLTDASVVLHVKSVQIAANDLSALNKRIEIPFNGEREKTENENKRHCRKRGKSKTVKCAENVWQPETLAKTSTQIKQFRICIDWRHLTAFRVHAMAGKRKRKRMHNNT